MLLSDFDFHLPAELIAQRPLPRRDASRMMVVERRTGTFRHERVRELPGYFAPGDALVINTSRVVPARVWGRIEGSDIEFLFLGPAGKKGLWEVLCRPARRVRPGSQVLFAAGPRGMVAAAGAEGRRTLDFGPGDVSGFLNRKGFAPLPPYIKRPRSGTALRRPDLERYQTVYARRGRSIAAPTAGLHFTPSLLRAVSARGAAVAEVELQVGLATFQPIREERLEDHRMLEEEYRIPAAAARTIEAARRKRRRVTAVGTTVVRTLESAALQARGGSGPGLCAGPGRTSLFIKPGHEFKAVDRLMTNFHLPRSSLLILVSAFAGRDLLLQAYREAVREGYRFFSYGDCMLIL